MRSPPTTARALLRVFSRPADGELSVRVLHREVLAGVFGLDDDAVREGAVAFPEVGAPRRRAHGAGRGRAASRST